MGNRFNDRRGAFRWIAALEDAGADEHALGTEFHHERGIRVFHSDRFHVGTAAEPFLRLSVSNARSEKELQKALRHFKENRVA